MESESIEFVFEAATGVVGSMIFELVREESVVDMKVEGLVLKD